MWVTTLELLAVSRDRRFKSESGPGGSYKCMLLFLFSFQFSDCGTTTAVKNAYNYSTRIVVQLACHTVE